MCLCASADASEAQFTLGQYYFSREAYTEALGYFERAIASPTEERSQAQYQLGVMYYDGLGVQPDMVSVCTCSGIESICTQARGFQYMMDVASSSSANKRDTNLLPSAQYNVGRAYFMVRHAIKLHTGYNYTY